jgi:Ni/Fe-hydrogenase subunit HybB-like protein
LRQFRSAGKIVGLRPQTVYLERFTVVVPTLSLPRVPSDTVFYTPTWVEVFITLGFGATFIFLYMLFTKFFPIVSIWEVREGRQVALKEVRERVEAYTPHATAGPLEGLGAGRTGENSTS